MMGGRGAGHQDDGGESSDNEDGEQESQEREEEEDLEFLEVPVHLMESYTATIGHLARPADEVIHANNAVFEEFMHPCYGRIACLRAISDIEAPHIQHAASWQTLI